MQSLKYAYEKTVRSVSFIARRRLAQGTRQAVALLLVALLLSYSIPSAMAISLVRQAALRSNDAANQAWTTLAEWLKPQPLQQRPGNNRGVKVRSEESKAERQGRANRLEISPGGDLVLQPGQPLLLTAVPVDREGTPIHGLQAEWETSNHLVVAIRKRGEATAGKPGQAILTAKAGQLRETVRVRVVEGDNERFGGKKKEDSRRSRGLRSQNSEQQRAPKVLAQNAARAGKQHHALRSNTPVNPGHASVSSPISLPPMPLRAPNDDPLPDNETSSLYAPANALGSPPGKKRPGALTPATATDGTENGNKNFSFAFPVLSLPGRGLDVSFNLVHNSQVFNKSTDPFDSSTWMTYDVDSSWPATGWRMSLGQIEDQGSYGFTLTDADGTRHSLVYTSAYNYDTIDGTYIHYYGGSGWGVLYYPDGTIAYYGAAGGGYRTYPTEIIDPNGNYILISYAGTNGAGPKISTITDTLGRYVHFYYASNGDLVAITKPGLTGGSDLQAMRFYYTDVSISQSGLFGSGINVNAPSSVHTLQYVYLASATESGTAHLGYRFYYSDYGMMYQIKQFRGMTVSSTSTSTAGSVTSEGSEAAVTTYDYPTTASALTDVPTYSHRTDDWAGRTVSVGGNPPSYTFAVNESTGVSSVTAPDGTINESHAIVDAGQWDDGLVSDTYVQYGSGPTVLTHKHMDWEQDSNSRNPRIYQTLMTDEAGLTSATVVSYTSYNNVSAISERDFTTNGSVSSTELRRTETTYVTSSSYTNRHVLHLPSMVKVFPGGSSTPISRVDYTYDNYGSSHANMTARDDIIMHSSAYDPFSPMYEVQGACREWDYWQIDCLQWDYYWTTDYDASTDYRGNVTSVTTYPDATTTSGAITRATTYDIAGNVTSAEVNCCQSKSFTYSGAGTSGDYAYPISAVTGDPGGLHVTMSATFDYNTGLPATATDENSQVTTNYYNSDSLRLDHIVAPDGGAAYFTYNDALSADANGKYHFYVLTQTKLDAPGGTARYMNSYQYFDGRGAVSRTMENYTSANGYVTQDTEHDALGRAYRTSNPYYASAYSTAINSDGFWTTTTFDHLGRITDITMPRGDDNNSLTTSVHNDYAGIFTTVTDQTGKQRRQKVDALGRVIRLDEPNSSNALGSTSSPNQATEYEYDALGNLVHVHQDSQHRYFKFDSLARLIRERLPEKTTNSSFNLSDSLTGNSSWSRKVEYNSSDLITDSYDARGVHATFSYDGLNRLTQVGFSDSTPTTHYYYDSQSLPSGAPSYTHSNSTGRLLAITYGSGATGNYYAYDSMGRPVTQKQVTGSTTYSLAYTYNYGGLMASETYPSGRVVSYGYDEGARVTSVSDGSTTFANSLTYSAHGGLTSETWGNGAVHSLSYNRRLQASEIKLKQSASGSELQRYNFSYGQVTQSNGSVDTSKNNGQIGRIDGYINGASTKEWDQRFVYDELGRLGTAAEYQQGSSLSWQAQYTYDRYGNRFQSGSGNSGIGYVSVTSGDIDSATNRFIATGSTPTTYDSAGNVTQDTKFRGMNYGYDANGRMITAARTDGSGGQTSIYDGTGQRVQTSANNVTRTMVYDIFNQLVADYLGSSGSTLERENVYRGGQLLAIYEAAGSCYKSISQFVQDFYQGVIQTGPNSTDLTTWTTTLTQAQAQGQGQMIAAAQSLGSTLFNSTAYSNLSTSNAQFITDLYTGYLQRSPDTGGYNFWLGILNGGASRASLIQAFALSGEFGDHVAALCVSTSSTSSNLKYVLSDLQGTTRAVMNNSGSGSSTIVARHDYLPFGEEIWSGTGTRSSGQGYAATDQIRQKYGMLERDDATGLDHTWWRKYESFSGRWTSPDPNSASARVAVPQSFNRYNYTLNDPINLIDPTGLMECFARFLVTTTYDSQGHVVSERWDYLYSYCIYTIEDFMYPVGGGFFTPGAGGGPVVTPPKPKTFMETLKKCVHDIYGVDLKKFTSANKGVDGVFEGKGLNAKGTMESMKVTTNVWAYSMSGLAAMNNDYVRNNPNSGHPTVPRGRAILGVTFGFGVADGCVQSPYLNYLANNPPSPYDTADSYRRRQVHELGHSLATITGKYQGEAGEQLEKCVYGNTQNQR